MKISKSIFYIPTFLLFQSLGAQTLLERLDKLFPKENLYEIATFKTTRIGLGHSVETRAKGSLEISMFSRYWNHKEGTTQRFLADEISFRFGLDYAITDRFTAGIGYTNFDKITDGFLKYKILRQNKNSKKSPLSVVFFQGISFRNGSSYSSYGGSSYGIRTSLNGPYPNNKALYNHHEAQKIYSFTSQVLLARKFNPKLSAQLSPTFITRNASIFEQQPKNQYAIGLGARYKVGQHVSIVSEYYNVFNPVPSQRTYNPFLLGVNWELSHLLLQFQLTNTRNFAEDAFITQTENNFNFHNGNLHFGFNATFVLHTKKNKW